jgi:excisionase family DNA binding protein
VAVSATPLPHAQIPARVPLTGADVMTAAEVSELLQIPVSTVYYLAPQWQLPASRVGRAWRFLRPRIGELLGA